MNRKKLLHLGVLCLFLMGFVSQAKAAVDCDQYHLYSATTFLSTINTTSPSGILLVGPAEGFANQPVTILFKDSSGDVLSPEYSFDTTFNSEGQADLRTQTLSTLIPALPKGEYNVQVRGATKQSQSPSGASGSRQTLCYSTNTTVNGEKSCLNLGEACTASDSLCNPSSLCDQLTGVVRLPALSQCAQTYLTSEDVTCPDSCRAAPFPSTDGQRICCGVVVGGTCMAGQTYLSCSPGVPTGEIFNTVPNSVPCKTANGGLAYQCALGFSSAQGGTQLNCQPGLNNSNTTTDTQSSGLGNQLVTSKFLYAVNPLTITGNSHSDLAQIPIFGPILVNVLNGIEGTLNLARFGTPASFLNQLLPYLFSIAGLIMFFMFVWGGFEMIYRQDDPKVFEVGKNRITAAVIGFFLLFASYWIAQLIQVAFGINFLG